MDMQNREKALLEVIRQGLEFGNYCHTQMLGARSEYLGVSDLAKYSECPRAAVLAKISEQSCAIERLLPLQRGHWFEAGIGRGFKNMGLKFFPQMEIRCVCYGIPIRAHLDFTLVWERPHKAVRIVEVKSMDKMPDQPYPSHITQAQSQVNLLCKLWNEPVFHLADSGNRPNGAGSTFPELCKSHFGIILPLNAADISAESWLLYISMKNVRAFGPYVFENLSLQAMLHNTMEFWRHLVNLKNDLPLSDTLPYAQGYYPLCAYCEHNASCPKFQHGETQPQWASSLQRLDKLKSERAILDNDIKEIETALKQTCQLSGVKGWIESGSYRFRLTNAAGRKTLDRDALQNELTSIFSAEGIEHIDVAELFARHERTGAASSRLNVMPINQ